MSKERWLTFPVEFNEGLVTSQQPVALGLERPGAARRLVNMEASLDGGYQRILGYNKYSTFIVPPYGAPLVHLSGQTGTTLVVANLAGSPLIGDVFSVAGVTGNYTVSSVTYSSVNRRATLGFSPALASSPPDRSAVTFTNVLTANVEGVFVMNDGSVVAKRNGALFKSQGLDWTYISVPNSTASVQVFGGSQTGSTLIVDGLNLRPQPGDTFSVVGLGGVFTVVQSTALSGTQATLTIDPSLPLSPSDNANVTFLGAGLVAGTSETKLRATSFRIGSECETMFVDGVNRPYKVVCSTGVFSWVTNAPAEAVGATLVSFLRSTIFFGKSSIITYSAPAQDNNFTPGDGAGVINTGDPLVSLISFKDTLVMFHPNRIKTLVGSSSSDFVLKSFTDRIGCVSTDSVLEVGGDVMYLGPDGVRFLSDTDRSGDLTLNVASQDIRKDMLSFITKYSKFQALLIRKKNQYRLFGYTEGLSSKSSEGWSGTQFANQGESRVKWSQLQGFKVFSGHSLYRNTDEIVVFTDRTPIIYRAEATNNFDGEIFNWSFWTPFWSLTDTTRRKSFFKANLYTRLQGDFSSSFNLVLDFEEKNLIQPSTLNLASTNSSFSVYGDSSTVYGVSLYGGSTQTYFGIQTTGAGHVFSIKFNGTSNGQPFTLDTLMIEFSEQGRK